MNVVIRFIGPLLVRLISSEVSRRAAQAIVRVAFDRAQAELIRNGQTEAAEVLQAIEDRLIDDPSPLVYAAEQVVLGSPTVAARNR